MRAVTGKSVFEQPAWVVVRPQKGRYLFYNSRTDEMHLIPPTGHAAYCLCDGINNVDDVATSLSPAIGVTPSTLRIRLEKFLAELELRGLVERTHA